MPPLSRCLLGAVALVATALALSAGVRAETGHDLWLRYAPLPDTAQRAAYRQSVTAIVVPPGRRPATSSPRS